MSDWKLPKGGTAIPEGPKIVGNRRLLSRRAPGARDPPQRFSIPAQSLPPWPSEMSQPVKLGVRVEEHLEWRKKKNF